MLNIFSVPLLLAQGCVDDPAFQDSNGWTCALYKSYKLCEQCGPGPNWESAWPPIENYGGLDACCITCECGSNQIINHNCSTFWNKWWKY